MRLTIRIILITGLLLSVGSWGWKRFSRRSVGIYFGVPALTSSHDCDVGFIVLNVSQQHSVKLNHDAVQLESLASLLRDIYKERYDHILFVRADPELNLQAVMEVLDLAKGAVPDMHLILLTPGLEQTEPCLVRGQLPDKMGINTSVFVSTSG